MSLSFLIGKEEINIAATSKSVTKIKQTVRPQSLAQCITPRRNQLVRAVDHGVGFTRTSGLVEQRERCRQQTQPTEALDRGNSE